MAETQTKTSRRTIGVVFAMVRGVRTTLTGNKVQTVSSASYGTEVDLLPEEEARLEALGALMPKAGGEAVPVVGGVVDHASIAAASSELTDEDGVTQPRAVASGVTSGDQRPVAFSDPGLPPFSPVGASIDALKDWLQGKQNTTGKQPSIDDIVALVGDDAATARMVLQAEDQVTDGEPRSGLAKRLAPVAGRS